MSSSCLKTPDDYSFLDNTLTILSVDHNPFEISELFTALSELHFFKVITVATARKAIEILNNNRVHVCLTELSIDDINNDPYFLPQSFSQSTHFLAISGQHSCAKGCEAIRSGILEVIDKPFNIKDVCFTIFYYSVKNILAPVTGYLPPTALDRSLDILINKSPCTVSEWANKQNITSCTLRELWQKRGISPKEALFIWNLYRSAFLFYVSDFIGKSTHRKQKTKIYKHYEMFFLKRSLWLEIINTPVCNTSQVSVSREKHHNYFSHSFAKVTGFQMNEVPFN